VALALPGAVGGDTVVRGVVLEQVTPVQLLIEPVGVGSPTAGAATVVVKMIELAPCCCEPTVRFGVPLLVVNDPDGVALT
jgi:hypothetical protein